MTSGEPRPFDDEREVVPAIVVAGSGDELAELRDAGSRLSLAHGSVMDER